MGMEMELAGLETVPYTPVPRGRKPSGFWHKIRTASLSLGPERMVTLRRCTCDSICRIDTHFSNTVQLASMRQAAHDHANKYDCKVTINVIDNDTLYVRFTRKAET